MQSLFPKQKELFRRLQLQFWAVAFLVVSHLVLTGYVDPLDHDSNVLQVLMVR